MQQNIAMQWLISLHCRHARPGLLAPAKLLLQSPCNSWRQLAAAGISPTMDTSKFIVNTTLNFLQNIINLKLFLEEEIKSNCQI